MTASGVYVGLMSGTSADAIDVALVQFDPVPRILASLAQPWPKDMRERITALARTDASIRLAELGQLDSLIATHFAHAATALLQQAGIEPTRVRAIGSHGQTICHRPDGDPPFTLQLGDPARIAELTGIDVVADFRRGDVAAGGQGAPLLPALHQALFADTDEVRVVLNLGGIANVTVLAPGQPVLGFDTGPANCLMDAWAERHLGTPNDAGGTWAASGTVDASLLQRCLADPYFHQPPPKSSGREYFNLDWLTAHLHGGARPADVQATLMALSTSSIGQAIATHAGTTHRVIACGGGVHNQSFMAALERAVAPAQLQTTVEYGIDPDFVEAAGFAWLARQRLLQQPGNLPSVTGASGPRVLGVIASAPR